MSIYFPGDEVRVVAGNGSETGVIEDFGHDIPALLRGKPGDKANVRLHNGELITVSVAALEPVAR
jgi:hypothetical protein